MDSRQIVTIDKFSSGRFLSTFNAFVGLSSNEIGLGFFSFFVIANKPYKMNFLSGQINFETEKFKNAHEP